MTDKNTTTQPNQAAKDTTATAAETNKQASDATKQTADTSKQATDTTKQPAKDTTAAAAETAKQASDTSKQAAKDTTAISAETATKTSAAATSTTMKAADSTKKAANTAAETGKQAATRTAQATRQTADTAKGAADIFAANAFELPNVFRDLTEKNMTRAKSSYETYKSFAEDTTDAVEDALTTANKNASEIQRQALVSAKAQMEANFDHAEKLLKAKTFSEAMELQSSFMRQQFDAMQSNFKEFQAMSSRFQQETTKPFTQNLNKVMEHWRVGA